MYVHPMKSFTHEREGGREGERERERERGRGKEREREGGRERVVTD